MSDNVESVSEPLRYEGVCKTCGEPITDERSDRVEDELAGHVDDGTDCYDYRITAVYPDGTERRAA